jgi:hypothetical protein
VTESCPFSQEELSKQYEEIYKQLKVTSYERNRIELATRQQNKSQLWHDVRLKRLTGWKSSQILKQQSWTPSLLKTILYQKPFISVPAHIKWGQDNEVIARQQYIDFMHANNHYNLTVQECGFFVHPQKEWLGASPDGVVLDPTYNPSDGLLEIKCPYSIRDAHPLEACYDTSFYCFIDTDGLCKLKKDHQYYHQVQVQLFVCSDKHHWCDFCVYTTKGIIVERINQDIEWIQKSVPKLQDYFDNYTLPELVYPMHKPSYFL